MSKPAAKTILGQPSWVLATREIYAAVTVRGAHLGPVSFRLGNRRVQPFAVAPWWNEPLPANIPPIIRVLRGDFFCLPFGGNTTPFRGEHHPVHGETANNRWRLESLARDRDGARLHLSLRTRVRPGRVDKHIRLLAGQTVIYQEHIISGMTGPMSLGHHAMLKFPDRPGAGRLSTSKLARGQVFVEPTERPEQGGYSILKPGALFRDLRAVPMTTGQTADLSRYPARRGFEDIAILVADPGLSLAWNAVAFPREGYVWFSLRDPRVLAATLLWCSNGGRHYPPWNGRHKNVMGIEDLTSFFHYGLAESARPNELSRAGFKTHHRLHARRPFTVRYIMGLAPMPRGFQRVKTILAGVNRITLVSDTGQRVETRVDVAFLRQRPA
jgi:hypothetical protein